MQVITILISTYGYLGIFILMTLESALVPIPSEITMQFAGFLVGRGLMNFWVLIFIGATGNLFGSLLAYYLGFLKGEYWTRTVIKRWGGLLLVHESDFDKGKSWFERYGQRVTFVARLLPIVRTFISLPAGIAKMNLPLFSLLTFVGSLIWSGVLAYLGLKLGENWNAIEPYFRKFQFLIIVGFTLLVFLYLNAHLKKKAA